MSSLSFLKIKGRVLARQASLWLMRAAPLISLTGCGRAPSFNILGSFFPAWLICMVIGILLAAAVKWALTAVRLESMIAWGILAYPCLAALFAFTLWLVFFS